MPRGVNGPDVPAPEIPREIGFDERRDHRTRGTIDMDAHRHIRVGLVVVSHQFIELRDIVELARIGDSLE